MLTAQNLAIGYHSPIATGITLEAREGMVTALLGGNGVGKSTLLRTLSGELKPQEGSITLCGSPIDKLSRRRRAGLLSIVASADMMAGALTVRQLVELGRQPHTGSSGILSSTDHQAVTSSMTDTGIIHKADDAVATLSDGERQKAMIARALAQDTKVMLLDEPLSFLDPAARIEVFSMLCRLARSRSKAIVLSCHDVALSLRMADRLWLFTPERKLLQLPPEEAIGTGAISRLFDSPGVRFDASIGDFVAVNSCCQRSEEEGIAPSAKI